jgi:hypothetical protein
VREEASQREQVAQDLRRFDHLVYLETEGKKAMESISLAF